MARGVIASELYEELAPLMRSIAYRMLGSVTDAEDVVQEAFLRYHLSVQGSTRIESPRAYLATITTRLAIDHLRRARKRRETYVGEWIPEPVLEDPLPTEHAETADSLSLAFLVVLETLSPVERAVFLLHDVFDYEYREIAAIVGKSEENCRQLARRARRHVEAEKPRFDASREQRDALAARFFAAVERGDVDGLVELLAADVVVHGDGGGKAPQWAQPIVGADRVARLFAGLGPRMKELGVRTELRLVNGQPGALILDPEGRLVNVFSLDIVDGAVQTVRSVINPDKLRHIGPVADARALLRRRRG